MIHTTKATKYRPIMDLLNSLNAGDCAVFSSFKASNRLSRHIERARKANPYARFTRAATNEGVKVWRLE